MRHLSWRFSLFVLLLVFACNPEPAKVECKRTSDCQDLSKRCEGEEGKCIAIVCNSDGDCREGWLCNTQSKACEAFQCQVDIDCKAGERCKSGRCEGKPECTTNLDCKDPAKPACKDGKCQEPPPECTQDTDCSDPSRPSCKSGRCLPAGADCLTKDDCKDPAKPRCLRGACVTNDSCETNADCTEAAKPLCLSRVCSADARPSEGEACEAGITDCKDGLLCHNPVTTEKKGLCRASCLTYQPTCSPSHVCQQRKGSEGACVPRSNGLSSGEECEKAPCENDLRCISWKGKLVCAAPCEGVKSSCRSREECYLVRPKDKEYFCVSERDPCGPGRPCPEGFGCNDNLCDPPLGCDQITCGPDDICEKGICRKKRCPTEIQCKQGETCDASGVCLNVSQDDPPCVPCNSDGTCSSPNAICLTGLGSSSTESFCIETCSGGTACTSPLYFQCRGIGLNNGIPCIDDTDCDTQFPVCDGNTCTNPAVPLCWPNINTCKNRCKGVTCNAPKVCLPTAGCVELNKPVCAPCQSNDECGGPNDLCLNYPAGAGSFCGQDCTSAACPTGFQCFAIQGSTLKQCAKPSLTCP